MKSPQPTVSMADKVALIDSLCAKARILPVITIAREQDVLPLADALAAVRDGRINNAASIIALQWLALNRDEVRGMWS